MNKTTHLNRRLAMNLFPRITLFRSNHTRPTRTRRELKRSALIERLDARCLMAGDFVAMGALAPAAASQAPAAFGSLAAGDVEPPPPHVGWYQSRGAEVEQKVQVSTGPGDELYEKIIWRPASSPAGELSIKGEIPGPVTTAPIAAASSNAQGNLSFWYESQSATDDATQFVSNSPVGNAPPVLQAHRAGSGWGWIELREGATDNGYNKGSTDAGSFHVIKLVNVKHHGAPLNGDYWVTVYDNDGKELKKAKITFENGNATLNTGVSINRDLNISKVGVSTPPK
jgi:hypothetical protein